MVLFVYGTLRRSAGHPMHHTLRAVASFVGEGRVRGRLYLIDHYPGLVLDETADWVHGELYRLRDPSGLASLDVYEGAGPEDPAPHEFRRVQRPVEQLAGRRCLAWIYEYRWPIDGLVQIISGDFLQHEQ